MDDYALSMYYAQERRLFGIRTSDIEIRDLLKAWAAITIAFTVILSKDYTLASILTGLVISAVCVGSAFLLHELGHKLVAQRYRCFAEFRSNDQMLLLAIAMSFVGFIFAAPGAVMIAGRVNNSQNGHISLAGPLTNFILAALFLPFSLMGLPLVSTVAYFGLLINTWIGLFNMLPFLNFDGKKILRWSKQAYISTVIFGAVLLIVQQII